MDEPANEDAYRVLSTQEVEWVTDLVEEARGQPFLISVCPPVAGDSVGPPIMFSLLLLSDGGVLIRSDPKNETRSCSADDSVTG